ncbi:Ig-like domain-containing protein [Mycobacterium sp. NPDC003323]
MATHRKSSSKKRMRAGEFAVAAFLGLAVTAAPAVAAADTTDGPTNGPSSDSDSTTTDTETTSTGPVGSGGTGAGPSSALDDDAEDDDAEDDDAEDDADAEDDDAGGDETLSGGDETLGGGDNAEEEGGEEDETGDDQAVDGGDGTESGAGEGASGGTDSEVVVAEPEIIEPVESEVVEPPAAETPVTPTETDKAPVISPTDIAGADNSAQLASMSGTDPTPTPPALASALLEIDIVPEPPSIPAFAPFMGVVNALANWVDQIFPPFESDPILNPTQVAAGWVMTLFAGLQGTYWNGQPTPFTFGALVLMTAAYQRYERLATNHLPEAPTVSAGPLPLTWKLKSVDPDGDPLIYSVDLNGQPSNGLITMSPDGTFSFVPSSLDDLNNGTDVTFTVRVNDSLGFLENPLTPDGNDAFYTVTFRYPGLGINNLPAFQSGGQAVVTGYDPVTGKVTITAQATDPDGDELTYTATSLWGDVVRNEDGSFTYTPTDFARHAAASLLGAKTDLITIWANDGRGGITVLPTAVTVDIISANTPPTVTVGQANTEPITGIITGSFDVKDEDGDLVIVTGDVITSRGGVVVVTPLGYAYTPTLLARSQGGTDTFTVTLNDAHGGIVEVAVTVTINRINTNPIGGITTALPDSDGVVRGTVAATDFDGDDLTFTLAGGASSGYSNSGGIVLLDSDGSFTFIPKPGGLLGSLTLDSFEVTISDGRGGTATTTVTLFANLEIDPVVTSNTDGVISGGLDIDDNDNTGLLTYGVGSGPSKGTVTVNADGTYTYTATTAGWNESDTFTIVGTVDGKSITIATVTVVPRPNVAPTSPLIDGDTVVGGSGIATGTINASDENGDTLHYSVTGHGGASTKVLSNGAIVTVDQNGKWHYIPGLNSGTLGVILASSFTVYISDGKGGETSTLVTVNTHNLKFPVTKSGGNGTVTGGLGLTAGEQGLMTYSLGNGPAKGTVTVNADGTYTYTATTAGWNESDTFTIMGTIGGQTIAVAEVTVVPKANTAPTADLADGAIIAIGSGSGIATGNVGAEDADGDALHHSVDGYGGASTKVLSNGAIVTVDSTGKWTYIPGLNSGDLGGVSPIITGSTFTVYISDGKGGQVSTPVIVTTHELDIPVTKVGSNGTVTGGLGLTAGEQGLMTYSLGSGPSKGTVTVNADGTYTYTATTAGWNESDTFTIVGTVDGQTITVAEVTLVPKVNKTPTSDTLGGATILLGVGSGIASGNVGASDADGDTLHYSVTGYGGASTKVLSNGAIVTVDTNGKWTYIPGLNSGDLGGLSPTILGSSFTVYVSDGKGGQTTTSIVVTTHELDIPVTKVINNGTVTGGLQLTASEQGVMTYSVGTGPARGTVTVHADGTFTYTTTTAGWNQSDSFTIMGTVGGQSIVLAEVSFVPKPNNLPTTNGSGIALGNGIGIAKGNVGANDADGDALTYSVTAGGASSQVRGNGAIVTVDANGNWAYVPKPNSGALINDTITIYVTDSRGGVTSHDVNITTAQLHGIDYVSTGTAGQGRINGIPSDNMGLFTFSKGTGGSGNVGAVTVASNGVFTYTGALNQAVSFNIVATVGGESFVIQTVNLRPPTFTGSGAKALGWGGAKTRSWTGVTVNDPDGDDTRVTVQSVSRGSVSIDQPTWSIFSVSYESDGGSFFNTGPNANFVLRVTDEFGFYSTATFTYP